MNERPDLFSTSIKLAAKRQLSVVDLVNAAERLTAQGEPQSAAKLYTAWILAASWHSHCSIAHGLWRSVDGDIRACADKPGGRVALAASRRASAQPSS
jgi:hypothetical protein